MHENIKFTVKLSKDIHEYQKCIPLNSNAQEHKNQVADWQAIHADNAYGTHYFIYAKFIGQPSNTGFKVNKVQLYLQNYSGAISIGFSCYAKFRSLGKVANNDSDYDHRYPDRKKFRLIFSLEAFKIILY